METPLQYVIVGRMPWSGMWLNRHYLARELARRERVVYVLDPMPTRPAARRRARAELRAGDLGGDVPPGVTAVRPREWPLQRFAPIRRWNDRAVERRIRRHLEPGVPTVIAYLPRTRLFAPGALDEALSVYLCSDDYRIRPDGTRNDVFCEWENATLEATDLVITITDALRDEQANRHPRVRTVENGYDPAFFHPFDGPEPEDVADLPRPRVGFVGSVRPPLLDLDLARRTAVARPAWSFCFVGWYDDDDPALIRLRMLPNVHVLGPRNREELAGYIAAMDVMTCPYPKCRLTEAASPLKAYESVGVGRPLVATHIPMLNRYRPVLRSEDSEAAYLAALEEILEAPPVPSEELVTGFTWGARAAELRGHIAQAMRERNPDAG